jgi:hypothetical protein
MSGHSRMSRPWPTSPASSRAGASSAGTRGQVYASAGTAFLGEDPLDLRDQLLRWLRRQEAER